jgi:heptaprenyl diphosphate synthase
VRVPYPHDVVDGNPLEILPTLEGDLARVETQLQAEVTSDLAFMSAVARHLVDAGGKRIRPGFALAAAATGHAEDRPVHQDVVMGAVSVELVHQGSLYHDDVMDEATTRRSVPSVNANWGNHRAILAGDFLLARASQIAAELGTEVAALLAATIARLCEGQVQELEDEYNVARTVDDYIMSITGKTASLLGTACRVGAITGSLPRADVETLTEFGHSYGMAFQIVDDILDVTATDEQLGKPSGNDLMEGNYTLPVLLAIQTQAGAELRSLLGDRIDGQAKQRARDLVASGPAVGEALDVARSWADKAAASLSSLDDNPAAAALRAAADHLVARVSAPLGD